MFILPDQIRRRIEYLESLKKKEQKVTADRVVSSSDQQESANEEGTVNVVEEVEVFQTDFPVIDVDEDGDDNTNQFSDVKKSATQRRRKRKKVKEEMSSQSSITQAVDTNNEPQETGS